MSDLHQRLAWEDLIEYVELGEVIPILGEELLRFDVGGRMVPLDTFLATRLAARLRIDPQRLPGPEPSVSDVIVQYVRHHGGAREEVDQRLNTILREADLPIPEPLRQLASIRRFRLFVSLTFDPFMARAIDAVRYGGERRTQELAFSINDGQDLPAPKAELRAPVVYHLLGRLSPTPSCALTEEDTLEFLQGLQSPARRPNLLLDELKTNHLLLIGCRFSDWLGRLLLRIAKSRRLSEKRTMEVLVWSAAPDDALVRFLADFSSRTKFEFSSAAAFVAELAARMAARPAAVDDDAAGPDGDDSPGDAAPAAPRTLPPLDARMVPGALFISYTREDLPAARRLRDALDAAGFDVWLDVRALEEGTDYEIEIRRAIRACSYFLPIISRRSVGRAEGFFWREWRWAAERAETFAPTTPFVVPVVVDDTRVDQTDALPACFRAAHVAQVPDGQPGEEFVARIRALVRDWQRRARG